MLRNLLKNSAVNLFAFAAKVGVHRLPGFHRVFLTLYPIYKRHFEAGPIDRLREFVPEGSVVIDVGANVGFFSLRFAEWVGSGGKVIAIEPEDRNYDSLIAALTRAGVRDRVDALKAVASAEPGTTFLEINPLHPADHKLSRNGVGLPVAAVTLDALVDNKGPLRPALVKIDVQGAEMLTLQGMTDILKLADAALFIELSEQGLTKFGSSVSAILQLLAGHGYAPYWLTQTGHQKANRSEIDEKTAGTRYADVLFLKNSWSRPASA